MGSWETRNPILQLSTIMATNYDQLSTTANMANNPAPAERRAHSVAHANTTPRPGRAKSVAQTLHGAAASALLSPVPGSGAERTDEEGAGAAAVPPPGAPSKRLTLAGMASALDLEEQVEPKRLSMPRRNHPTKTVAQLIVHTHKDSAKAIIDAQPRSSTSLSQVEDRENGCGVRAIVRVDDPIAYVEGGDDVRRQILERDAPEMLQYVGDGGRVGLSNVSRMYAATEEEHAARAAAEDSPFASVTSTASSSPSIPVPGSETVFLSAVETPATRFGYTAFDFYGCLTQCTLHGTQGEPQGGDLHMEHVQQKLTDRLRSNHKMVIDPEFFHVSRSVQLVEGPFTTGSRTWDNGLFMHIHIPASAVVHRDAGVVYVMACDNVASDGKLPQAEHTDDEPGCPSSSNSKGGWRRDAFGSAFVGGGAAVVGGGGPPPADTTEQAPEQCHAFRDKGQCRFGGACRRLHGGRAPLPADKGALEECLGFQRKRWCHFGEACRRLHDGRAPLPTDPTEGRREECRFFRDNAWCGNGGTCRHLHRGRAPRPADLCRGHGGHSSRGEGRGW